jgi:RHS repeat-associated protein
VAGLYEKRLSGTTKEHVYYVLGPRGVVAQVTRPEGGSEDTKYLHSDNLGSVDGVSTAGGTLTQTKRDPYGNAVSNFNQPKLPTTITASTIPVRLGFTGHEQDDELGMINMRGRMFDPRLGRFLTPDPITGSGPAFNRYSYVLNKPFRFRDPTGLVPSCAGVSSDRYCEVIHVNDPTSLPAESAYTCDPEDGGGYICQVTRPKAVPLPIPDEPVVDPSRGGDHTGIEGGASGASGGTGTGGPGMGSVAPPPPNRMTPQDCTHPCGVSRMDAKSPSVDPFLLGQFGPSPSAVPIYWPAPGENKSDYADRIMTDNRGAVKLYGAATAATGAVLGGVALILRLSPSFVAAAGAGGGTAVEQIRSRREIFLELWGQGVEGARATLAAIESGSFRLSADLTVGHLQEYRQIAQSAIDNGGGDSYRGYLVQSLRLQIIDAIEPIVEAKCGK